MASEESARRARARARKSWPGALVSLDVATDTGFVDAPPAIRIAMVYELTLAAWAMAGQQIPDYDRSAIPTRIIRPSAS